MVPGATISAHLSKPVPMCQRVLRLVTAVALLFLLGCGDSSGPNGSGAEGTWQGGIGGTGVSVSMHLALTETNGTVTGNGNIVGPDYSISLTANGTFQDPNVSLTLSATG